MEFTRREDALLAKSRLTSLLAKTGLAKKTAKDYVMCVRYSDTHYETGIVVLKLHCHCLRYKKYKDNESLRDLVISSAANARMSQDEVNFLLLGMATAPIESKE